MWPVREFPELVTFLERLAASLPGSSAATPEPAKNLGMSAQKVRRKLSRCQSTNTRRVPTICL